jgi:hypothetical protein
MSRQKKLRVYGRIQPDCSETVAGSPVDHGLVGNFRDKNQINRWRGKTLTVVVSFWQQIGNSGTWDSSVRLISVIGTQFSLTGPISKVFHDLAQESR